MLPEIAMLSVGFLDNLCKQKSVNFLQIYFFNCCQKNLTVLKKSDSRKQKEKSDKRKEEVGV